MEAQNYPIGIQSFDKLIEGGFTYVDKTHYIARLVKTERYYFLSRPRRFGKSLMLSTLHAYFDGRRDLFKGLYLDTADVDWTPTPVLHFDFNSENYNQPDGLEKLLDWQLKGYEDKYGIDNAADPGTFAGRFGRLIKAVHSQTGRKVAVLIDEYDKPLLELEENEALFQHNQAILKSFFGNLKSMDRYIRFGMLTGVARFNKVSIFSDVNNLDDISMTDGYADICGWTEKELTDNFQPGINALAIKFKKSEEKMLEELRNYYDGYLFSEEGSRLYNPFSVLQALSKQRLIPYWFSVGTPTFLAKRVKKTGIVLPDLGKRYYTQDDLLAVGMGTGNPMALMFQTGYLTINSYDMDRDAYTLRFPNREVEIGFAKNLYPLYANIENNFNSQFDLYNFKEDLYEGDPEAFMTRLQTLLKNSPFELQNEGNYQNIVWLLCTLCGTETVAETHSYKGRSDLEVKTSNYLYVFEFKYNESVEAAMAQLRDRDYAGRHQLEDRTVYLIGANFSTRGDERGLTGWEIEQLSAQPQD